MTIRQKDIFSGFFLLGYVARNIDTACKEYTKNFGTKFQFFELEQKHKDLLHIERIAFGKQGSTVIKIVEPKLDSTNIFSDFAVENPRSVRLHHLGYLINDYYKAHRKLQLDPLECEISMEGEIENCFQFFYADTRSNIGLFSEFIISSEKESCFFSKL